MDYVLWTRTVYFLTVPVIFFLSFTTLRTFWRKTGQFPTYWACVHVVSFGVFTLLGLAEGPLSLANLLSLLLVALSCWLSITVRVLVWWKFRHTKSTPPE